MKTIKHCVDCYNDRYNHPGLCERPGVDAPVTSEQCWRLAEAKLITGFKLSVNAPMNDKKAYQRVRVPSCYRQMGFIFLEHLPKQT
jgi:hypothetical protein